MLVNPAAGSGRALSVGRRVADELRARGITADLLFGANAQQTSDLAHDAVASGVDALVACGGDGMVHPGHCGRCDHQDRARRRAPCGTGNDFARSIGLSPKSPAAALKAIIAGYQRSVDLGRAGASLVRGGAGKEPLSLAELEAATNLRTGRKHVLSILVENKSGVLTRIAGLFARRGFNIDTLTVGPTDDEQISRVTLTVDGALHPIDQVTKQLHKLVNVLKIRDLEPADTVARELALFKITADGAQRGELMQIAEIFRGKVVDVTKRAVIVEVTGTTEKIEAFEGMVRPFGLIEMMRTGEIAISRGRTET